MPRERTRFPTVMTRSNIETSIPPSQDEDLEWADWVKLFELIQKYSIDVIKAMKLDPSTVQLSMADGADGLPAIRVSVRPHLLDDVPKSVPLTVGNKRYRIRLAPSGDFQEYRPLQRRARRA